MFGLGPNASFAFPSKPPPPKTPKEWQAVLQEVKQLYENRQYKQCAARATDLLAATKGNNPEPIYASYLAFHAAVSFEYLGSTAHLFSSKKVTFLESALNSFLDCLSTLPASAELPTKVNRVVATPPPREKVVALPSSPRTPSNRVKPERTPARETIWETASFDDLQRLIEKSLAIQQATAREYAEYAQRVRAFAAEHRDETPFVRACLASAEGLERHPLFRLKLPSPPSDRQHSSTPKKVLMPSPLKITKPDESRPVQPTREPPDSGTPSKPGKRDWVDWSSSALLPDSFLDEDPVIDKAGVQAKAELPGGEKLFVPRPNSNPQTPVVNQVYDIRPDSSTLGIFDNLIHVPDAHQDDESDMPSTPCPSPRIRRQAHGRARSEETAHDGYVQRASGSETPLDPVQMARTVKFNRHVEQVRSHIKDTVSELRVHLDRVLDIQHTRRARKMQRAQSFWSFTPAGSAEEAGEAAPRESSLDAFGNAVSNETKEERIARLRAEGWRTVGLRNPESAWKGSHYYKEFCNMVLNELTLQE
ncbi:hypothetical protein N7539_001171 [Penicillium diatomitis]|uniref:Uncharacterized protein n=1 Tax=Penicillium diatomitis TaxID=2819901 RepID=A0A9W9XP75_9EURO|nr:uncharacterized protein N7539_001171 [Penicillium diatomitis]KAJ5496055.1 hypothetical protein N7539_001171 [Penicillium diatomitis]